MGDRKAGVRMKQLHKDIVEATGGGGIEDSIGVVGSSIGKSAAQGSRKRNIASNNAGSRRGTNVPAATVNLKNAAAPDNKRP